MKSRAHIIWSEVKKRSAERHYARLLKKQKKNARRFKKVWRYKKVNGGVRVKWREVGREQRLGHLAVKRKIIK